MQQWYLNNRRLFHHELNALFKSCPLMMLSIVGSGHQINSIVETVSECTIAHGTHILEAPNNSDEIEYGIALCFPNNYPKSPPIMYCNDPKLPVGRLDRHILSDGQACLEVRPEVKRRWPPGSNIVDFIKSLVDPFLAWQTYYDAFGKPPAWGERNHGKKGVIEYYAELLGRPADESVTNFLRLIARKNQPKGHEICPCGSGKKLRDCHRSLLYKVREYIDPEDALYDLKMIEGT